MKKHITAFYLETLVMIAVFICTILILSHIFGIARSRSAEAKMLTSSVTLVQNTAEAMASAATPEGLMALVSEGDNAGFEDVGGGRALVLRYDADMTPNPEGELSITVRWRGENGLVYGDISASETATQREIYAVTTAVYTGEVRR